MRKIYKAVFLKLWGSGSKTQTIHVCFYSCLVTAGRNIRLF